MKDSKKLAVECFACKSQVLPENDAHRGLLGNKCNFLRSQLMSTKEQLINLEKKSKSNHHAAQRERELITILAIKEQIKRDEVLLNQLENILEECYG